MNYWVIISQQQLSSATGEVPAPADRHWQLHTTSSQAGTETQAGSTSSRSDVSLLREVNRRETTHPSLKTGLIY